MDRETHRLYYYSGIRDEKETIDWQIWNWQPDPYYGVIDCACAETHCEHRVERAIEAHNFRKIQWLSGREGPWPFTYDNYAGIEGRRKHWWKFTDDLDCNKKRPCDKRGFQKATRIDNIRLIRPNRG